MNYWVVKFAPFRYGWKDILKNGKFEIYSVRNFQARNNLKEMRLGDEVLFYHSQEGNCVMGSLKVNQEAHQDPTTNDDRWVSVTFEPIETFENPLQLNKIRHIPELQDIGLIKQPRLSVVSLKKDEFDLIRQHASR